MSAQSEPRSRGWQGPLSPRPAAAPAGASAGGSGSASSGISPARSFAVLNRDSLPLRLTAFAALAAFATAHWAMLVENAPLGRTLLVLLVATGGAAVIGLLSFVPLPRPALHALAAIVGVATLCLGLMAAGLPGRLLLPAHWSELDRRPRSRARGRAGGRLAV